METLTLDNVNFGNSIGYQTYTVTKKSLGGTTLQAKSSLWTTMEIMNVGIQNISRAAKDILVAFLITNAAKEIRLIDSRHAKIWTGMVTSPIVTIRQKNWSKSVGKDACVIYDIDLEFSGRLI